MLPNRGIYAQETNSLLCYKYRINTECEGSKNPRNPCHPRKSEIQTDARKDVSVAKHPRDAQATGNCEKSW